MARRARQGVNPVQIAAIAVVLALVGGGILFGLSRSKDSMRSVSELDLADYVNKGDGMGGTVWKLTGIIAEKLRWTPDRGQIVSVNIEQGGLRKTLPVLIPPDFNDTSINIGDQFTIKVEVGEQVMLVALDLVRS